MPTSRKRDLSLAVLVAALVAAGGMLPLYRHYHHAPPDRVASAPSAAAPSSAPPLAPVAPMAPASGTVASAAPGAPGAGLPGSEDTEAGTPPAPPGAEVVPTEEAETDRGPNAAVNAGPGVSFGRASGLKQTPDPTHLNASAAVVVDRDTGQTLLSKNADAVLPIASLTKLMTTLLVTEAKQPMDEVLTITEDDVDLERHSRSRLKVGTQLTREEALRLALMSSENRAAHALGRNYPGGLPRLVEAMNAKARALGMKNTTYVDPTGLSNRNRSTAHDLSLLVAQAVQNPLLREFSTTPAHLASLGGHTLQYRNSNRLVRDQRAGWDIALQKTGYIVEAGRCLTMATKVGGHDLIMVLLDTDSNATRVADVQRMRRWVVAKNGWQDNIAVARAEASPPERKAAPAPAAARAHGKAKARGKTAVAKGKDRDAKVAARAKKPAGKAAVAADARKDGAREGRVRQTFTARHSAREKDDEKDGNS